MNFNDIKALRDLHDLLKAGIITENDFSTKKNEFLNSNPSLSQDEKINFLKELHQLKQEGILTEEEFNAKKQNILNSSSSVPASAPEPVRQEEKSSANYSSSQASSTAESYFDSGAERTLHELSIDGLNMKLSNEKLYVNSATSNETFALRSVNGIGIVDLVDKYNTELAEFKEKSKKPWIGIVICLLLGFWFVSMHNSLLFGRNGEAFIPALLFMGIAVYLFLKNNNLVPPKMASVVRVMLSGGSRDFEFNKKSSEAPEVAKFVALVEDTLTAYHKNN